jgi:hypothetical protein
LVQSFNDRLAQREVRFDHADLADRLVKFLGADGHVKYLGNGEWPLGMSPDDVKQLGDLLKDFARGLRKSGLGWSDAPLRVSIRENYKGSRQRNVFMSEMSSYLYGLTGMWCDEAVMLFTDAAFPRAGEQTTIEQVRAARKSLKKSRT